MYGYEHAGMHQRMLADDARTRAFRQAIVQSVKPGDVVCDVGTGTGILAFFACEAGAKRVYAIELTGIVDAAKQIAEANGLSDRIIFLAGDARAQRLPEAVDVLVSEWLGNAGIEENMLPPVVDIRDRFLKPDGVLIPRRLRIIGAPVEAAEAFERIEFFNKPVYGFDFSSLAKREAGQRFWGRVDESQMLSEPAVFADMDLRDVTSAAMTARVDVTLCRDGLLHGLALWFESEIAAGVTLHTGPDAPKSHWQHVLFPIGPRAVPVLAGGSLSFKLESRPVGGAIQWRWTGRLIADPGSGVPVTFEYSLIES